jgi:hypothetical protein
MVVCHRGVLACSRQLPDPLISIFLGKDCSLWDEGIVRVCLDDAGSKMKAMVQSYEEVPEGTGVILREKPYVNGPG